jgi:hypothetical protein
MGSWDFFEKKMEGIGAGAGYSGDPAQAGRYIISEIARTGNL